MLTRLAKWWLRGCGYTVLRPGWYGVACGACHVTKKLPAPDGDRIFEVHALPGSEFIALNRTIVVDKSGKGEFV